MGRHDTVGGMIGVLAAQAGWLAVLVVAGRLLLGAATRKVVIQVAEALSLLGSYRRLVGAEDPLRLAVLRLVPCSSCRRSPSPRSTWS